MKKSISVSNLTLDLYLDYVKPAARAAGILEEVPARDDWHEFTAEVTEETAAAEIGHCMTVACFNANKDGEERTHEQFVENEARQMLYQMEVSMEYRPEAAETIKALYDAMTAMLTTAPAEEQTTETETTETEEEEEENTVEKIKVVYEKKEGRTYTETWRSEKPEEVYERLAHCLIAKKLNNCGWIRSIKRVPLYNGFDRITVTHDNGGRDVYTVTNH